MTNQSDSLIDLIFCYELLFCVELTFISCTSFIYDMIIMNKLMVDGIQRVKHI